MSDFLETALAAAKKAEAVIMKHYSTDVASELKPDNSPVTAADREAEAVIVKTIREMFPNHGFVGEEGASKDADLVWVIDPIDGTINYMRGIFLFSTEIALMKGDDVLLGVSNTPALKTTMHAERGGGAFLNGKPIRVSRRPLEEAYFGFGNLTYFEELGKLQGLVSLLKKAWRSRGYGDFIGYHFVATGGLDAMLEARLHIWDVAAQKIIVEEAGGRMTDFQGAPITRETSSAIASNGRFHDEIVEALG